uniref:Angio-associated migratory cell protein n=1 Tax=Graphocephala atropunctata TaxID=36148 RepID=A0A1B6KAD8_9HEMI
MDDNAEDLGEDLMVTMSDDESEELFVDDVEEIIVPNNLDQPEQSESDEDQDHPTVECPSSPIKDDSEFVFKKHTGPVFCCALDPVDGNLAVTGGEDEKAYVWVIQTGEVVFECLGHKDSVTMAGFSHDGKYLATGDMTGYIQVWKVATRNCVMSQNVGSDMAWMQWHHGARILLYGQANGDVNMWRVGSTTSENDSLCKLYVGYNTCTDCAVIMPDGRRMAVGYADGGLKMYDLKSAQVLGHVAAGQTHSRDISCIDAHSDNNIIATGGGDGKVTLFKSQPLKLLWSFNCCEENDSNAFVEAIGFSRDPTLPLLAVGTLNGKLFILDFTRQVVRHKCVQESGICRLVWDRHSSVVFVGGLDGIIRLYDARSGKLQSQLRGHKETILDIFLSKDGNTLLSASDDATSRVFAVSQPER